MLAIYKRELKSYFYTPLGYVFIAFFMLVVCFIINSYYKESWAELRWLVPVVLILFIIWNYKTVQALIADPTIARRIVRDDEEIYQNFIKDIPTKDEIEYDEDGNLVEKSSYDDENDSFDE